MVGVVHRFEVIWKREGLRLPLKWHKRRRLGGTDQGTQRLGAKHRNHVWSYNFVFDQTESGRRLKWLVVLNEYTRECLGLEVEHAMGARKWLAFSKSWSPSVERRNSSVATTALNSSRGRLGNGYSHMGLRRSTLNPERHGKTPTRRASMPGSGTSSSMWNSFPANWRQRS